MKSRTQFDPNLDLDLVYNPDEVPGFQNHASESISRCLQRFAAGDTAVLHDSDDDAYAYREQYFEDDFHRLDRVVSNWPESSGNPVSSDSGAGAHPSASSGANNPGDTEIVLDDQQIGRNPDPNGHGDDRSATDAN